MNSRDSIPLPEFIYSSITNQEKEKNLFSFSDNTDSSGAAAAAETAQFEIVDAKALLDELSEADPNR